MTKAVSWND